MFIYLKKLNKKNNKILYPLQTKINTYILRDNKTRFEKFKKLKTLCCWIFSKKQFSLPLNIQVSENFMKKLFFLNTDGTRDGSKFVVFFGNQTINIAIDFLN